MCKCPTRYYKRRQHRPNDIQFRYKDITYRLEIQHKRYHIYKGTTFKEAQRIKIYSNIYSRQIEDYRKHIQRFSASLCFIVFAMFFWGI